MSLSTEVTSRYSLYTILGITNPDDPSAVSNGTTMLTAACTDAEADFEVLAQVEYDSTDARHVRIAVERVVAILYSRLNREGGERRMQDTKRMFEELAAVSSRSRVLPRTSSTVVRSSDEAGERPDLDRSRMGDFVPGQPPSIDPWNR